MSRVWLAALVAAKICAGQAILYVAPNGSDAGSGNLAAPFATLERARGEVRRLKAHSATVFVRGGTYQLAATFQLGPEDSGTIYRAYKHEKPVLSGGKQIRGFVPYKGRILKADAAAQGLKGVYFRQLFYEGKRQILARYPNFDPKDPYYGGWAYAGGKPLPMYKDIPQESARILEYKSEDARNWLHPEEGEVFVFPRYNWWNNIVPIKSIDRETRAITLAKNCSFGIRANDRYYVENLFEELDSPGEWYLDKRTWTLYFWPPDKRRPADVVVDAPAVRNLVELARGTTAVTFRGFTLEYGEGAAISLTDTTNCLIAGNTIRNLGDYHGSGVVISGGSGNGAAGNDIYEIGNTGVALSGGDRITFTPANNYADNNHIYRTGVFYKQGTGISMNGCGLRASHNLIHDTPRMGIIFHGNNLVIEYNHIHHVNLETSDTGVVYTGGRDWISSRGTVIRYNYMHDSIGYGQDNGQWRLAPRLTWGVYLDDNTGGVDVIGNIVARAPGGLVHLHNGRDNLIENNILVGGTLQQVQYNGWRADGKMWTTNFPTMVAGYNSVKDQPAWKKMRNMDIAPAQAVLPSGLIMSGNVFRRNIVYYTDPAAQLLALNDVPVDHNQWDENLYWHGGLPLSVATDHKGAKLDWAGWRNLGPDRHSLVADPLFVSPQADDYRLRPNSPAFKLGFEAIPIEKIGPYKDELRATRPVVEERR